MTETSEQIKKAPVVSDETLDAVNLSIRGMGINLWRAIAQAQRNADAVYYEGVIQRLVTQTRKVLQPIDKARREAVYDVEAFLEDEGLALYYTRYKGDERLPGEQVSIDIIRRVLEREDE